jgi:hypothetical protein
MEDFTMATVTKVKQSTKNPNKGAVGKAPGGPKKDKSIMTFGKGKK